jgi:hypothetical protein
MAEPKVVTYTNLDEAKAACAAENQACKEKGEGKERFVFNIAQNGEHRFYVVATLSGKACAIGARALGISANVAEKKTPQPQKSVAEQLTSMSNEEREQLKALLAQLDGSTDEAKPTDEVKPAKKSKKSAE